MKCKHVMMMMMIKTIWNWFTKSETWYIEWNPRRKVWTWPFLLAFPELPIFK